MLFLFPLMKNFSTKPFFSILLTSLEKLFSVMPSREAIWDIF